MKVFISWSGEPSREVAKSLRTGIKSVFDKIVPFVSDVDIEAGSRGLQVIEDALQGSGFGIIVVTPDNMEAPWLNFEAGALSKALGDAENRVVPLLIGFTTISQLTGPLSQFQARIASTSTIRGLLHDLAEQVGVEREIVDIRMDSWVSSFMEVVEASATAGSDTPPRRSSEDVLDELLDLVRSLRRDISTPEPRATAERKTSDARTSALMMQQIRLILEASGIKDGKINNLGDKEYVVDLPGDIDSRSLSTARQFADTLDYGLIFRDGSGVVHL